MVGTIDLDRGVKLPWLHEHCAESAAVEILQAGVLGDHGALSLLKLGVWRVDVGWWRAAKSHLL